MKKEYLMPTVRVAKFNTDYLMLGTSDTPADPDEPVLGKEIDLEGNDNWVGSGHSVWED